LSELYLFELIIMKVRVACVVIRVRTKGVVTRARTMNGFIGHIVRVRSKCGYRNRLLEEIG